MDIRGVAAMMFKVFVILVVLPIAVVTGMQSYWNHQDNVEFRVRVERLMTDPSARPDPWTASQDAQRMLAYDAEIRAWVTENFKKKRGKQ